VKKGSRREENGTEKWECVAGQLIERRNKYVKTAAGNVGEANSEKTCSDSLRGRGVEYKKSPKGSENENRYCDVVKMWKIFGNCGLISVSVSPKCR